DCQVHTDQMDLMEERGTLDLIEAIELLEPPEITALQKGKPGTGEPILWAVHVISPSGYSEKEFKKLIDKLLDFNIGIIWCPSAGISMRRIRPQNGPLHNAAPRVLDFLLAGVWVVLGTDNNDDMMVPAGCGNPIIEIVMAANIARFYVPHIWAKLGAGIKLNAIDRNVLEAAIRRDHEAFQMYDPSWQPAIAV
ncbi:MAG: hypothetical protein U9Q38_08410, partial [Thermodesulfobacteriota bacterium]|nr:hypothetical protein [Thermodesulfobacteriota bacterium]